MKKNKTLLIAGGALLIWFLLKKKKTTKADSGETAPTATAPTSAQTRLKQRNNLKTIRTARKTPADVSGIIY